MVELTPTIIPVSGILNVMKPGSSEATQAISSLTIDSVDTTISAVVAQDELTLTSITGITVGRSYMHGGGGLIRVAEVSGSTIILESPVPGIARAGDTIKGVRCTAAIAGTNLTPRGLHWRLEWRLTDAAGDTHDYIVGANVVRQRFADPMTAAEAARYVSSIYPSAGSSAQTALRWIVLAERASARVRRMAIRQHRYVHLAGDVDTWVDAGECALRVELCREGLFPPGADPGTYRRDQEEMLSQLIDAALSGSFYDANDDGVVDTITEIGSIGNIRMVRQ